METARGRPDSTRVALLAAAILLGCGRSAPDAVPPGSFAFGVFGDGPYYLWENGRFDHVLADVDRADLAWFLHVGDILDGQCSDEVYAKRLAQFNAIRHPVVYTPGDNEWTDCHASGSGGYDPLDRLAALRRVFFSDRGRTLGRHPMPVITQAADPAFAEFPENVRWRFGGFVFATVHVVGSSNGGDVFPGRTAALDAEVQRRTDAALAWIDTAFAQAKATKAHGVVLAMHADMGLRRENPHVGFERLLAELERQVADFPGSVLLIHGDSHIQRVDQPLMDARGKVYENFTRLEVFGSPDIGWVRVVVDTVAGRITRVEPRLEGWW
jgi:hypothetical protein